MRNVRIVITCPLCRGEVIPMVCPQCAGTKEVGFIGPFPQVVEFVKEWLVIVEPLEVG